MCKDSISKTNAKDKDASYIHALIFFKQWHEQRTLKTLSFTKHWRKAE